MMLGRTIHDLPENTVYRIKEIFIGGPIKSKIMKSFGGWYSVTIGPFGGTHVELEGSLPLLYS